MARSNAERILSFGGIMAEHGSSVTHHHGMEEHEKTYQGFIKGSIALTILCLYVVVALVAFAFIESGNVLIGFAGLIIGIALIAYRFA